jgi:hypothetical protein
VNVAQCNEAYGWLGIDDCSNSSFEVRFPLQFVQQNIGSRVTPFPYTAEPCPLASQVPAYIRVDTTRRECIWSNSKFYGWQYFSAIESGAASYARNLFRYFGI